MRRYPKSNSDIKTTMDVIVNKFRNKGIIDSILILKYVGSILYLEKVGLGLSYEKNDCDFDLTLSDAPQIDKSSAIYPILENNIKQMESILGNAMHQDIVGMLLVSFYDVDEYLEWFDYLIDIMPTIKGSTEYITPDWLSVLADAFICFGEKSVFCPFGGAMKLSTDMNFYEYMYAYEINTSVWELGMIRLALSNDSRKVSFENIVRNNFWGRSCVIASFSTYYCMYIQGLHYAVYTVLTVMFAVKSVNPERHSSVSEDMSKPFIIFQHKRCNHPILFFLFRNLSIQPFVIRRSRNIKF